jgi:hypothetical protein
MSSYKPDGWTTISPRLMTRDVHGLVEFMKHVFGATGQVHADGSVPAHQSFTTGESFSLTRCRCSFETNHRVCPHSPQTTIRYRGP